MNILHISAVSGWGGGENHIENLCLEFSKIYPDCRNTIFCVEGGKFHKKLKKTELNFITAPLRIKVDPRYFLKLGRITKTLKIDIIHLHDPTAIMQAIAADKLFKLPPFVFSKKTSFPIKNRKRSLYKYNYPKIKKILCVSKATKSVAEQSIIDTAKLEVIYHGTNFNSKSTITPFTLSEKLNLKTNSTVIGNIGNHIRAKNLETFIEVANVLINKEGLKNLSFVQIGSFTDRTDNLEHMIKDYKLSNHVHLLGHMPMASNFISQFNFMLITSQSEGIPQVIYESMYHGTPVVSTNVGGIPEILEHEVTGMLSPMHDPDHLSKNLVTLLSNTTLKQTISQKAKDRLDKELSTETMAQKTYGVYRDVLSNNL